MRFLGWDLIGEAFERRADGCSAVVAVFVVVVSVAVLPFCSCVGHSGLLCAMD